MFACVVMCVSGCWYVCVHVGARVFCVQVPMVGEGVVDALVATLAAVRGGGARALPVQEHACAALRNLALAADNQVRLFCWGRSGCGGSVVRRQGG